MKKNGFVFVESVTVLIVVALSLTMSLSSYELLSSKSKQRKYYDLASDKYLLWTLNELGNKTGSSYQNNMVASKDNCSSTTMGTVLSNCVQVFKDTDLVYFIKVNDVEKALKNDPSRGYYATKTYDNGTIEYLKTLKRKEDDNTTPINYIVGVFYRKGKYYYASIIL